MSSKAVSDKYFSSLSSSTSFVTKCFSVLAFLVSPSLALNLDKRKRVVAAVATTAYEVGLALSL